MAWTKSVNLSATHRGREESCKDIQKGLWTEEEDSILLHYIKNHGEGHWDFVARCTGLKRTGKSCRLRWLNYLRPGIRHGNFTLQEQLKILELYLHWGNRWSKIAESMQGRTDNEIKNFWRTRVQKQAKQLNCDVNSKEFRDMIRNVLMPRLAEQIRYSKSRGDDDSSSKVVIPQVPSSSSSSSNLAMELCNDEAILMGDNPLVDQFQHVQNEVEIVDQVGDDIWNDENVNFLRQLLFGDHNVGSETNLERENEEGKMFV